MEYIVIITISIAILIVLKFAWNIKIKDIKRLQELGYNEKLNEITNKLPENKEICKTILIKLKNENVKIEEDENSKTSLYLVISDSIIIANIKNTFTRVQTVAHECLHSIQNRKTLLFNFIFSNIYFIYFNAICILTIFKIVNKYQMMNVFGLTACGFIYYSIRSCLEMDAMIKARTLAEKYMEKDRTLTKEEQDTILENYDIINNIGIKLTNYTLIIKIVVKIIIYAIICVKFG